MCNLFLSYQRPIPITKNSAINQTFTMQKETFNCHRLNLLSFNLPMFLTLWQASITFSRLLKTKGIDQETLNLPLNFIYFPVVLFYVPLLSFHCFMPTTVVLDCLSIKMKSIGNHLREERRRETEEKNHEKDGTVWIKTARVLECIFFYNSCFAHRNLPSHFDIFCFTFLSGGNIILSTNTTPKENTN